MGEEYGSPSRHLCFSRRSSAAPTSDQTPTNASRPLRHPWTTAPALEHPPPPLCARPRCAPRHLLASPGLAARPVDRGRAAGARGTAVRGPCLEALVATFASSARLPGVAGKGGARIRLTTAPPRPPQPAAAAAAAVPLAWEACRPRRSRPPRAVSPRSCRNLTMPSSPGEQGGGGGVGLGRGPAPHAAGVLAPLAARRRPPCPPGNCRLPAGYCDSE